MQDQLTACLQTEEATVRKFLANNGHKYVATYGPLGEDDIILNGWQPQPPSVIAQCGFTRAGQKVLIHTKA
jgi:hypothetical protein